MSLIQIIIGARMHEFEEYDSPVQVNIEHPTRQPRPEIVKPGQNDVATEPTPVIVEAGSVAYRVQWIDQYGRENGQVVKGRDAALAVAKVAQDADIEHKVFCRLLSVRPISKS